MLVLISLMLKNLIFLKATQVEYNFLLIFILTILITIFIMSLISYSKMRENSKKVLLSIFYVLISLIILIDIMHFAYFESLPSVKMLSQAGQLKDVKNSIRSLINVNTILILVDIPFVIYYIWNKRNKDLIRDKYKKIIAPLSFLLIIGLYIVSNINGKIQSIKLQEVYSYHFIDIRNSILGDENIKGVNKTSFTNEDVEKLEKNRKLIKGETTALGKDKNLIVLQIEALQNFVIGLEYEGQEITPNLNRLIKDKSSIYYNNYYQLVGRGNTSDAEFVTNNSLHPSMETPTYDQYEDNTFYGLPWVLRDKGYKAWAFHGYKKDFWNREKAYVGQGFERFISQEDYDYDEEDVIGLGISDEKFFEQTLEYLKKLDRDKEPFYSFIVSLTSHTPFDMPKKHHKLKLKDEHKGNIIGNYLQSIHYTDRYIGKFIDGLKENGIYDNSVIAIYGDHFAIQNTDEEINEKMSEFLGHKYYYDDIMNIPLIISIPGEDLGYTNEKVGSQIDFMPTILNIMGYENNKGIMFGKDLNNYKGYNSVKPQTMLRKGSFIDKDLIFEMARTEIFDHGKAIDFKTREELDIDKYRDRYELAIEEINQSNLVLKNDLIKLVLENNGEINLEDMEFQKLSGLENIKDLTFDKTGNIIKDYKKENGYKVEIDSKEDEDGEIYINKNMKYKELAKWHKTNKNSELHLYIELDIDDINDVLPRLRHLYPESKKEYIIGIKEFDSHYFVSQYGYENIIIDLRYENYKNKEVLEFLNIHSLYGVVVDMKFRNLSLIKKLKNMGVNVYVEKDNQYKLLNK